MRGTGHDDAARGRRLCFSARSLRTSARIFIWLDAVSCCANRNDRSGGDRIRTIPRRFCASNCWRPLSDRADHRAAGLRAQSFERTIGRNSLDRVSHFFNTCGLRVGRIVQNSLTFTKTVALLGVIVIGLLCGWKSNCAALGSHWWNAPANGWSPQVAQPGFAVVGGLAVALLFGKAMVGPVFAQTAWTNVTFIGSEVREPGRNLSRALLYGCGIVVVLYVLANVAYIASLSLAEIQNAPQNRVAVAMMRAVFGKPGVLAMAAAIMISTFGCNNGLILAGARVYYAMARDNLFFRKAGTTNRFHVPAFALVVQAIWTALLTLPRTVTTSAQTGERGFGNVYTQLLEYIVSADLVLYVLLVAAVIVLRSKNPGAERPYRTWGYPIVPILSIALAAILILDLAYLAPSTSGIGILIVLTGVPVYLLWRRRA